MLQLENLKKKFGAVTAVDTINLQVPAGQFLGFLGPNGAGKTTTIKMVVGLLAPSSGKVVVHGMDIAEHPIQVKRLIGYIPDRPFIYEKLTGREFLEFIARLYKVNSKNAEQRIAQYLNLFGLERWQHSLVESYSHGMKQKLVMSAALLPDPALIIVDEPMVGLDPKGARLVKELFRGLVAQGKTIFMSTHTLPIAQQLCDRIVIIDKGRIIADGSMEELHHLTEKYNPELEDIFLELTSDTAAVKLADSL